METKDYFYVPVGEEVQDSVDATEKDGERHTLMSLESTFRFSCHRGLSCFTQCCSDVNIYLTPYDVLRMKKMLNLSSGEFLKTYTIPIIREDTGLPVVILKMRDEDKVCPFVTSEGCSIYEDRPWSCRSYPLQPQSSKVTDKHGKEYYSLLRRPFCLGFNEEITWTVSDWKKDQGLEIYKEMEDLFKEITLHKNLERRKITNEDIQKMFYMACYDIDRFRKFVFESTFLDVFDIEKESLEKIKMDDVELLKLGFMWITFGLINSGSLKIKKGVQKERKKTQVPETGPSEIIEDMRQKVKAFLIEEKGYSEKDIEVGKTFEVALDDTIYKSTIDLLVSIGGKRCIIIKCARASLASREREVLACARIFDDYAIPFAIVTDGENAEVLDTFSGEVIDSGLKAIPSKRNIERSDKIELIEFPEEKRDKEKRIYMAFESIKCQECE